MEPERLTRYVDKDGLIPDRGHWLFSSPDRPDVLGALPSCSMVTAFKAVGWWSWPFTSKYCQSYDYVSRSQWPCGLWRGSTAARLLGLWVRIPPRAWMSVCCECCVLSGRVLCDELITRPEESNRVWLSKVWSWSLEKMRRPRPPWGCRAIEKKTYVKLHF
jgi:hypothetical protein